MSRAEAAYRSMTETGSPERLSHLTELFRRAESAVNDETEDPLPIMSKLQEETGKSWEPAEFFELWGWTSPEQLAEDWAVSGSIPSDLNEDELTSLLDLIEVYSDRIVRAFDAAYGEAYGTNLIFHPYREMNSRELASEILRRKSLLQKGGQSALKEYEIGVATEVVADANAKPWAHDWAEHTLSETTV